MNNVWTAIAFRAPCARRYQAKPLLELFNGYARCQGRRNAGHNARPSIGQQAERPVDIAGSHISSPKRNFSTTSLLAARIRRPAPPPPAAEWNPEARNIPVPYLEDLSSSRLEPAQTVASHTEGLPPDDEGKVTWRDYDPEGGMPLPNGELPQTEINRLFGGEDVNADTGNYIISVLQWRRMSGALIDSGVDFPRASDVSRDQAIQGLQYVRGLDESFDEQAAGQRWADEESARLQEEIQDRAIKLGIYKKDPDLAEGEENDQGTPEGRERSGESELIRHREAEEARYETEQAEQQAKAEREELAALHSQRGPLELAGGVQPSVALTTMDGGGITIGEGPRSAWLTPVERKPWVKYYEEQANVIKENILPRLSVFRRLGPSLLITLATLWLCLFLSDNYTPPPKSARLWPDTPPAVSTLTFITVALITGFVLGRLPPFWKALNKYFTIVPAYPRAASMLGYMVRHDTLPHLLVNTATLWAFGLTLHEDVGRGTFLAIFLAAGTCGGFLSLTAQVLGKQWVSYAYGVSAAALGVVAATCTLRPQGTLKVGGYEVPFAAWVLLVVLGGLDVGAVVWGVKTGVDHFGHLGGIATGIAAAAWLRQRSQASGTEAK